MKKLDLNKAAEEFEMISDEHQLFYNRETDEFDFYIDPIYSGIEDDTEKFEEDCWIAAPSQRELNEYDIMVEFAETVTDLRANELLCLALEGRGAFRRFKDTLHRVDLTNEWYAFKHKAYVGIAREWCVENDIEYLDNEEISKPEPPQSPEHTDPIDMIIIPLSSKIADEAKKVIRDALNCANADEEVRGMLSKKRVAFAAIADSRVVGIIGAIPQYGVTGWELHPLAVVKAYQRRGIGTALIEALEDEVAARGGVTIYLGSDDESGTTSLYGVNLYDDTFGKIANIQNIGGHPFPFYEKCGYKIVGVFPDANGIGKPDIWMAKKINKKGRSKQQL